MFDADQIILNHMLASIGQTEDVKLMRGVGTEAELLCIVNQAADDNASMAGPQVMPAAA